MTKTITNGTCAVDSFTLLLSEDVIQVHDKRLDCLTVTAYLDAETGELNLDDIENPRNNPTIKYSHGSFSTYYKMTKVRHGSLGTKRYLTLTVNSKHLREQYLEGLTLDNMKSAYSLIMQEGIFSCTYEAFLEGLVWDVDIKRDFSSTAPYPSIIKHLKAMVRSEYKAIARAYQKKDNQGFQVSKRESANEPMLKTYNKAMELQYHSSDFCSEYLKEATIEHPYRTEVTLRRKSQMQRHGLLDDNQNNSLGLVLRLAPMNGDKVISSLREKYLVKKAAVPEKKEVEDRLIKLEKERYKIDRTVRLCVQAGLNLEESVQEVLEIHQPSKNYLARFKRTATASWEAYMDVVISEGLQVVQTPFD